MNFFRELKAFRDWLLINDLTTGAIALWYTLMSINNMAGWSEWFAAPNQTLQQLTNLSKQGLVDARNLLIQKGLIEYKRGKSRQGGMYRMISLVNSVDQSLDQTDDQIIDQMPDKHLTNHRTNTGPIAGPLIDIKTKTKTKTKQSSGDNNTHAQPRERNVFELFESEGFGTLSSFLAERLGLLIDQYTEKWVCEAMKRAALQGKRNLSYVEGILRRWQAEGIDEPWKEVKRNAASGASDQYDFGF